MLNTLIADLLIAGHGQWGNRLACRLLNRTQQASLFRRDKQNRLAIATSTAGATNTVHIGLIVIRDIKINYMTDALNIQTAGGHIGSHNHIYLAFLKAVDSALAQCLAQIAIEGCRGKATSLETLGNIHS